MGMLVAENLSEMAIPDDPPHTTVNSSLELPILSYLVTGKKAYLHIIISKFHLSKSSTNNQSEQIT